MTKQLTRRTAPLLGLATLGAFGLAVSGAGAQTIVAPNSFTSVQAGGQASSAPFNDNSRYQQIYAASQFSSLPGAEYITQIAFRPANGQAAFSHTFTNIQFDLSTTTQAVAALSSTFSTNVGPNDTVVFSGPLTVSSAATTGPGTSKAFDILVNLPTPFLYNPASGNLLLDIRDINSNGFTGYVDLGSDPSTNLVFVDNSTTAPTGTVQPFGIATRFLFTAVPEPSSVAAFGFTALGVGGLMLRARKRRAA